MYNKCLLFLVFQRTVVLLEISFSERVKMLKSYNKEHRAAPSSFMVMFVITTKSLFRSLTFGFVNKILVGPY